MNAGDDQGDTALHVATRMGRKDVVAMLLQRPDINEGRLNAAGRHAWDLTRRRDVQMVYDAAHKAMAENVGKALFEAARRGQADEVIRLMGDRRRAAAWSGCSTFGDGNTLLHAAVAGDYEDPEAIKVPVPMPVSLLEPVGMATDGPVVGRGERRPDQREANMSWHAGEEEEEEEEKEKEKEREGEKEKEKEGERGRKKQKGASVGEFELGSVGRKKKKEGGKGKENRRGRQKRAGREA